LFRNGPRDLRFLVKQPPPIPALTTPPRPPRRVRYHGTHPRRFAEKYKEHAPELYAGEVQKIMESGKTPAGMHRPVCVREILEVLAPRPGEIAVDATLGYGGHAREIIPALLPGGKLYGLDVDPLELPKTEARLRAAGIPAEALSVHRTNFAGLAQLLAGEEVAGVDIILADLGLSSMQIDNPERGFTFKVQGPLDLRMNPRRGRSAAGWLAALDEAALRQMLEENADEPHARVIAAAVHRIQAQSPVTTTTALAEAVRAGIATVTGPKAKDQIEAGIRRTFQALRIAVNDEFGALEMFLRNLPACLKSGGRVAILTFHSGEDRRVKQAFQAGERDGVYARIAREVIRPGTEEVRSNPRSSSAKLRWAVRA
jgi:16S rRNA (cytosine1402-N4)-methyltransferase